MTTWIGELGGGIWRAVVVGLVAGLILAACTGFAPQGPPAATDTGFLGCQVGPQPGAPVRQGDPLAAGQPMAGLDVTAMTPRQVGELARSRGLKVTWRYEYAISGAVGPGGPPVAGATPRTTPVATPVASAHPTAPDAPDGSPDGTPDGASGTAVPSAPTGVAAGIGSTGFSECWCEPPPDGNVTGVAYGMASELVVFVDSGRTLPAVRGQPARGWGC